MPDVPTLLKALSAQDQDPQVQDPQDPPPVTERQQNLLDMMAEHARGFRSFVPGPGADSALVELLRSPFAVDTLSKMVQANPTDPPGAMQRLFGSLLVDDFLKMQGPDRIVVQQPVPRDKATITTTRDGRRAYLVADVVRSRPDTINVKTAKLFDELALAHETSHTQGGSEPSAVRFSAAVKVLREGRAPNKEEIQEFPGIVEQVRRLRELIEGESP